MIVDLKQLFKNTNIPKAKHFEVITKIHLSDLVFTIFLILSYKQFFILSELEFFIIYKYIYKYFFII